jgi:CheY-like chemotaxis protein
MKDNTPGVRFEIYLPGTRDKIFSSQDISVSRSLQGNGEKILLIDDEPEQNDFMTKMLTNLGYSVVSARNGEEGLTFLHAQSVDLVLLDMLMGEGMNGRETYEKILQINPAQKAIVVSGYSENEEVVRIKHLGVSHFLEKPVTLPQMSLAIKQSLARQ